MKAIDLAIRWHGDQTDKSGRPYWEHCQRVARNLIFRWPDAPQDQIDAAILHDVLEDTDVTEGAMLDAGVAPSTIVMVKLLTKPRGMDYLAFIRRIVASGNVGAIQVKIADNMDNSDPTRLPLPNGFYLRQAERYSPARKILEEGLRACG